MVKILPLQKRREMHNSCFGYFVTRKPFACRGRKLYNMDIINYLEILKENRLKITPKRRAVIEIFLAKGSYLGPYEIRSMLGRKLIKVGLPSIYRILAEFESAGILIKVERKNRQLYYSLCKKPQEDHHHFICRECNKVEEVEFCNFGEISQFIEKKLKGKVQYHSIHIEGLCSKCK